MNDKNKLQITGYSDDIISLDGSIYDEFSPSADDDTAIIRIPDNQQGTNIKVFYDQDGIWRTEVLDPTKLEITIEKGDVELDTNDVLTIHYPIPFITWTCEDGKRGVCGKVELTEPQQRMFNSLKSTLDSSDFEDAEDNDAEILRRINRFTRDVDWSNDELRAELVNEGVDPDKLISNVKNTISMFLSPSPEAVDSTETVEVVKAILAGILE